MLNRVVAYLRSFFRRRIEAAMDPEVEIQSAIDEAKRSDRVLRNQAAKVIAHRTKLEARIDKAADEAGEARETAKQALLRADTARTEGDDETAVRMENAAQSLALKLQAAENNLESLKEQYAIAVEQAGEAREAVQQNAMRVQELASRRMELLGQLEQAKMQETVNDAMDSMTATIERDAPSISRVEEKIQGRLAEAQAKAELRAATPEGIEAELRESVSIASADAKLDELRTELGISGPGGDQGQIES